jgi:DNA polymerase-3 subunit delta
MHKSTFLNHLKIWPLSTLHKALSQSLIVEQNLKTAGAPQEAIMGRLLIALSSYSKRRS